METREGSFEPDAEREMAAHLERCPKCRALGDGWKRLHEAASCLVAPRLSPALEDRVRRLCHAEIEKQERRTAATSRSVRSSLPRFFWPAFGALLFLTVFTLIPGLKDIIQEGVWTYRTTMALVLIVQNVLMLLFAPLLLVRKPENGSSCA